MRAADRYCDYLAGLLRHLAEVSPAEEPERWQRLRESARVAVTRYEAERAPERPPGPHVPPVPPWRTQVA